MPHSLAPSSLARLPSLVVLRLLFALVFTAASAGWTSASAQLFSKPGASGNASGASAVVSTERVRAELVAHAPQGVAPGAPLWLGLRIQHQPGWHTYWKNPGDSGLPTELAWQLPAGLDPGEIAWPVPEKIRIDTLANYGYEGAVLLPMSLVVLDLLRGARPHWRTHLPFFVLVGKHPVPLKFEPHCIHHREDRCERKAQKPSEIPHLTISSS